MQVAKQFAKMLEDGVEQVGAPLQKFKHRRTLCELL